MTEEDISRKFQVHYYFDDKSHSMNAFVRNRAEKDFLEAVKRILELVEVTPEIETIAHQEGGLIETLMLVATGAGTVMAFLSPAINEILKYHFTNSKTNEAIKEETLKSLQLDNAIKELDYNNKLDKALGDKIIRRHVSSYYTKINGYAKVEKIGFKNMSICSDEVVIPRSEFNKFILVDDKTVTEDDDAEIEIISPVLKEGTFSWRGRYKEDRIDFSMGDSKFKAEVINGEHQFANGFTMSCLLQIMITFDEFGDEKRRSYSVKKVYAVKAGEVGTYRLRPLGFKKKMDSNQQTLFKDAEN